METREFTCKNCGKTISNEQDLGFNGLCSSCYKRKIKSEEELREKKRKEQILAEGAEDWEDLKKMKPKLYYVKLILVVLGVILMIVAYFMIEIFSSI